MLKLGQFVPTVGNRWQGMRGWAALVLCLAACGGVSTRDHDADSGGRGSGAPSGSGGRTGGGKADPGGVAVPPDDQGGLGGHHEVGGDCCSGAPAPDWYCQAPAVDASPTAAETVPGDVIGRELLVDESGNSYVLGTVSTEPGWYLLKLQPGGAQSWSKHLGYAGKSHSASLRFASNGDLLVGVVEDLSQATQHLEIFRYQNTGELVAQHLIAQPNGPDGPSDDRLQVFDNGDELEVWGSFSGQWAVASTTLHATSALDAYRIRVAANGDVVDTAQFVRAKYNRINHGVRVDGTTYLAVTGQARDTDPLLVALDDTLTPLWEHPLDEGTTPFRVAVRDGTLVVGGMRSETLFLATLDADTGDTLSSTEIPSIFNMTALGLLPDAGVLVGGVATPYATLGGVTFESDTGGPFVAAFSLGGEHLWSTFYCAEFGATVQGLGFGAGELRGLISFEGDVDLGSRQLVGAGSALLTLPNPESSAGGVGGMGGAAAGD